MTLKIVIKGASGLIIDHSSFKEVLSFNKVLNFRQEIKRILIIFKPIIKAYCFKTTVADILHVFKEHLRIESQNTAGQYIFCILNFKLYSLLNVSD